MKKRYLLLLLLLVFSLVLLLPHLAEASLPLVEERYTQENMDITYPQLKGEEWEGVNQILYEAALEKILATKEDLLRTLEREDLKDFSFWSSYEVKFFYEELLSLTYLQSYYAKGAAHPHTYLTAVTIDLEEERRLDLDSFFSKEYRSLVERRMREDIEERDIPLLVEFEGINPDQVFYLTNNHFVLCYQLYEYTPYAYGILKFPIPYTYVEDVLSLEYLSLLEREEASLTREEAKRLMLLANRSYTFLSQGGGLDTYETFTHNGTTYRYLGEEVKTKERLYQYLSPIFTPEAIEMGIQVMGIIEHQGYLAQIHVEKESQRSWDEAQLFLKEYSLSGVEYEVHVPLRYDSYQTLSIIRFREIPQKGWRIHTSIDSFY